MREGWEAKRGCVQSPDTERLRSSQTGAGQRAAASRGQGQGAYHLAHHQRETHVYRGFRRQALRAVPRHRKIVAPVRTTNVGFSLGQYDGGISSMQDWLTLPLVEIGRRERLAYGEDRAAQKTPLRRGKITVLLPGRAEWRGGSSSGTGMEQNRAAVVNGQRIRCLLGIC